MYVLVSTSKNGFRRDFIVLETGTSTSDRVIARCVLLARLKRPSRMLPCESTVGHAKGHDNAFLAPITGNRAAELNGHGPVEKLASVSAFAGRGGD